MRLRLFEKLQILLESPRSARQIKKLLCYNYWSKKKSFRLNLEGYQISFTAADYFSTTNFYLSGGSENYITEPAAVHFFVNRMKKTKCLADVGANLGYYSTIGGKVRPEIPIFAFELDHTLAPIIEENLRRNGVSNVTVQFGAVGADSSATVDFTPHPFSFLGNLLDNSTEPFSVRFNTKVIRLDDYFADKPVQPDFIKIDIERSEMGMLKGAERLLSQVGMEMMLEIHPHFLPRFGSNCGEVFGFLKARGFRCYLIPDFRTTGSVSLDDVTEYPEKLTSSDYMLFVTRRPPDDGDVAR
jgi:FkbM family methyltransferase